MIEEKITLDRETFKVLSSDTRIRILKYLNTRRMTLSELSKRLKMSVSTVKEHLDNLAAAGLIVQKDEGHKWKYYELTRKGKNIINPVEKKVFIILGLSVVAFLFSSYGFISKLYTVPVFAGAELTRAPSASEQVGGMAQVTQTLPYPETVFVMLSVILIIACVVYLFIRKRAV